MIIRYHAKAREEVLDAATHYGQIRPALGLEFLAELNTAIETISRDPLMFEQVRPGIRCCLLERFPYRVPDAILCGSSSCDTTGDIQTSVCGANRFEV